MSTPYRESEPMTEDEDTEEVQRGCYQGLPDYDESDIEINQSNAIDAYPIEDDTKVCS